jgi:uncharacterized protein YjgD (DUF1641 family)
MRSEATQLVPPDAGLEAEIRSIHAKVDLLAEQVGHLYGRARALEELKDELVPITRDALSGLQGELVAMEHEFNSDEVVYLLRKLLRATPRFIWLLDRLESVAALVQELEPLIKEVGRAGIERLDQAERRGYFRLLRGALDLVDQVAARSSPGDLEALSRNLPALLDAVKGLTRPRVLGLARSVLEAAGREASPPRVTLWGLFRALRDPEMQQGLGLTLEMLRGVARAELAAPGLAVVHQE